MSFLMLMGEGSPDIESGQFIINSHGKVVRGITENEYERIRSYEVRGVSRHWMFFISCQ